MESKKNEVIVKAIQHYQDRLDRYVSSKSNDKILYALKKLEKLPVRTVHLEETGVGRTVNALKKCGGLVGEAAKDMVAKWKMMVLKEEQAAEEEVVVVNEEEEPVDSAVESAPDSAVESVPDSSYSSENENYNSEQFETELNDMDLNSEEINVNSSHENKKDKNDLGNNTYNCGESSNKYKEYSSKNKNEGKRDGDIENENKLGKKRKNNEVESSDLESIKHRRDDSKKKRDDSHGEEEKRKSKHERSHSKRKRDSSESDSEEERKHKSKKSHHRREDSSDSEDNHKKHKSKSSKEDKDSSKFKSKEKTGSSSSKQSKEKYEKTKKHEDAKSSSDHSDKKDSSSKLETKSSKHEKESHKSRSHSSEKKDKDKHKKEDSKKSKDKHKSKERESTKKEKSSSSSKQSEKDKPSSSSSSSKHKPSSSSSTEISESKSKATKEKVPSSTKKTKMVNGIDSESGASFAEALGLCGPLPVISKGSSSKKKSSTSSLEKPESTQAHKWKPVSPSDESTVEKYVPEALKEPQLEPLNLNIDNLLPEISPNYRPLGFPLDNQPKRIMTDDEALSRVMSNRNQKTKVYSGNKSKGKVESLFDLCVRILQDNIDALEYTGGVPYSILKPILERATPDQLFNMEHHNPYLIEDTDELWQLHIQKDFRTKKREELESWREMYMRCLDEREARLSAITANIKQSQDKSLPVRTTKLAYVDSVAKPPRNIARKQVKNGITNVIIEQKPSTAAKLSALATSGDAGKVSVPNPGSRAVDRSSHSGSSAAAVKPKKAPLMAKTLSFLKNRFRR